MKTPGNLITELKQNSHLTLEFSVLQKHSETQKTIVESISAA